MTTLGVEIVQPARDNAVLVSPNIGAHYVICGKMVAKSILLKKWLRKINFLTTM